MHSQQNDHDPVTGEKLADPNVLVPSPATLVTPAQIIVPEVMEQLADDNTVLDEQFHINNKPSSDVEAPFDGHNDVDNEQPYGWVVVAAAFFVQAVVIGTVNGYGVYQVSFILCA
jgi:hypothetical protein